MSSHKLFLSYNHADSAAFDPAGTKVVTASVDGTARVWKADGTGALVVLDGHYGPVESAGFSRDGSRVVTASWDHTARVWTVGWAALVDRLRRIRKDRWVLSGQQAQICDVDRVGLEFRLEPSSQRRRKLGIDPEL